MEQLKLNTPGCPCNKCSQNSSCTFIFGCNKYINWEFKSEQPEAMLELVKIEDLDRILQERIKKAVVAINKYGNTDYIGSNKEAVVKLLLKIMSKLGGE